VPNFSEHFTAAHIRIAALAMQSSPTRSLDAIIAAAEANQGLQAEEAAELMAWGRQANARQEIITAAQRVRSSLAPKTVEFIIPVYLTSVCQNECLYCGYRKSNRLAERVRLSLDEFGHELDLILGWGHRQIELVLSDDPEFGPEDLSRYVELTRQKLDAAGGGVVALCAPVYEREAYSCLAAAGLDWIAEWQETYDREHFDRWHFLGSPKREYESRLEIWDRAIAGGIRKVALGALLGLYDWRHDVLGVIEHGNYLRRTYGLAPYALGIPRLKPARGVLASQKPSRFAVSDEDFRLAVSIYHLAFPQSRIFFNTREAYELNLSLVAAGDLFTVDCETLPGGYLRRHLPGQFSTHDYPSRREVAGTLEQRGFECLYLSDEKAVSQVESAPAGVVPERFDWSEWADQHREIRLKLQDWQLSLSRLALHRADAPPSREAAALGLRQVVDYFATSVVEHCRHEENTLFASRADYDGDEAHLLELRRDHDRFGIDLDKFERQLTSYELSGDPTVLQMLGQRMIRELRSHIEREEKLFKTFLAPPSGVASATRPQA